MTGYSEDFVANIRCSLPYISLLIPKRITKCWQVPLFPNLSNKLYYKVAFTIVTAINQGSGSFLTPVQFSVALPGNDHSWCTIWDSCVSIFRGISQPALLVFTIVPWSEVLRRRGQGKEHSTISFQHLYSFFFFSSSACVFWRQEKARGTQIVVLNETPISLKAGSLDSH